MAAIITRSTKLSMTLAVKDNVWKTFSEVAFALGWTSYCSSDYITPDGFNVVLESFSNTTAELYTIVGMSEVEQAEAVLMQLAERCGAND